MEFVSDFVRGEDKIRWGTCGFATYLISLYLSSNVQDQPPRPLARRGGNAHGISVNLISSRRASPSTQTVDQLAVLHAHKVHVHVRLEGSPSVALLLRRLERSASSSLSSTFQTVSQYKHLTCIWRHALHC